MRKSFKKFAAVALSAMMCVGSLAGCSKSAATDQTTGSTTAAPTTETTQAQTTETTQVPTETEPVDVATYSEAPMLAEQVKAGTLKAVDERIPDKDNIYVDTQDAAGTPLTIGNYGGTINILNGGGSWDLARPSLESIIRYNTDGTYYPNVIKSYEHNDDYTVWTFRLREGMKWSDGEDFTADDITFWYYMCHVNNFDSKASWAALKETVGEEEVFAKLTKVDDYTVTWTFQNPKFPADFIENGDFKWCWAPEHYLNDLIPSSYYVENEYYADTGLSDEQVLANAMAKGIDQATVKDLGKQATYYFWNISGIPTLNAFVLSTNPGNSDRSDDLCIMERNPYFWKVDAAGNQLPYVDALHFIKTSEDGQDQLMFRSGELDFIEVAMHDINSILTDLGDKVKLCEFASTNWGSYQITFNYTNTDKNYADLFANKDFRKAISICVDREKVSGLLSDGFLEPGQCAPSEGNIGYDPEWETKWTEYDVEEAKKLLEGCGLKMGSDGFYDFADGSDFILTLYTYTDSGASDAFPVLEQYFNAAGIKCATKDLEVSAFDTEIDNNNWCAVLGPHTEIGGLSLKSRVAPFVPIQQAAEWYGDYGTYYATGGAQGVAPTGDMAKLVELYEQWKATPVTEERDAITLDIYKIHKENMWTIAYLKAESSYSIVSTNIGNYPELLVHDDLYQYGNMIHYWSLYKAQ